MITKAYQEPFGRARKEFYLRELWQRGWDVPFWNYRLQWNQFPRMGIVPAFPLHIDIETTDACNLRCTMCVHGQGKVENTGFIERDFAKRIIKEAADGGVFSLKFNWRGEPALHRDLADLVRYAKACGVREVQLNTNGLPFNEAKVTEIVCSGLDRIIFSVDANTAATYEQVRVGGDFDKLVRTVEGFLEQRKVLGQTKPFVRVQMVRMTLNRHEVEGFRQRWQGRVDDVRVTDVTNRGQGEQLTVGDQVAVGRARCPQPWLRLVVNRQGLVMPCCSDWFCQWVVGDAKKQSLKEIWQGKKIRQLRNLIWEKRLNDFEPCRSCFVKESYTWTKKDGTN